MTRTLVTGGARSGKSRHAESLLAARHPVTYVATGTPASDADPEWAARVTAHRAARPSGWTTVETLDLAGVIGSATTPVLVDCLGVWLSRLVDEADAWERPVVAADVLAESRARLLAAWTRASVDLVAVTNEVGLGVVPATSSGRLFRDELGRLNAQLSAASEHVHLVVAGRVLDLSGAPVVEG